MTELRDTRRYEDDQVATMSLAVPSNPSEWSEDEARESLQALIRASDSSVFGHPTAGPGPGRV